MRTRSRRRFVLTALLQQQNQFFLFQQFEQFFPDLMDSCGIMFLFRLMAEFLKALTVNHGSDLRKESEPEQAKAEASREGGLTSRHNSPAHGTLMKPIAAGCVPIALNRKLFCKRQLMPDTALWASLMFDMQQKQPFPLYP